MSGDEIDEAFKAAKAILMDEDGDPTPHYEKYLQYMNNWKLKKEVLQRAFADPGSHKDWPINSRKYRNAVDKAMNEWIVFGHKHEIEEAMSTLAAYGVDPATWLNS